MMSATSRTGLILALACGLATSCGAPPETSPSLPEGAQSLGRQKGYVLTRSIWTERTIPVCWEAMPPERARERAWVQDAIARSWQANSQLAFSGWGQCPKHGPTATGIRIGSPPRSGDGPSTAGLGRIVSGKRNGVKLEFAYRAWSPRCAATATARESCIRANAVHEFGHALGFAHEHLRPDTPDWCREAAGGSPGDRILTPWDPDSIMNYCNYDRMREGGRLSAGDIASVQQIYGSPRTVAPSAAP